MKKSIILTALAIGVTLSGAVAQTPLATPSASPVVNPVVNPASSAATDTRPDRPPAPPWLKALDTDADGVISASEIANASASLLTLDANKDGTLTPDELHPKPPADGGPRHRGPHGPKGPGPKGDRGPDGHRPPTPPVIAALDTDKDGTLSAAEIAGAAAALKTADKNGDGQLVSDEIHPPRPPEPVPPGNGPDGEELPAPPAE